MVHKVREGVKISQNCPHGLWMTLGTEITTKYLPCTAGNTRRRSKIKDNWDFECLCTRCQDVTEFGTNYDAIKCQKCPQGLVLPEKALDTECDWKCSNCEFKVR